MLKQNNDNPLIFTKDSIVNTENRIIEQLGGEENFKIFLKELNTFDLKYRAAMNETVTKLNILNDNFYTLYDKRLIEHITSRIKSPESLANKMIRHNIGLKLDKISDSIFDVAGVRIICQFLSDIPIIVNIIQNHPEFHVIKEKDYIKDPKCSGYRSYHMIITVPIFLATGMEDVPVEIQIRTMGMDFWASLEHDMKYKFNGNIPDNINNELKICSESVHEMDLKMMHLSEQIMDSNERRYINFYN